MPVQHNSKCPSSPYQHNHLTPPAKIFYPTRGQFRFLKTRQVTTPTHFWLGLCPLTITPTPPPSFLTISYTYLWQKPPTLSEARPASWAPDKTAHACPHNPNCPSITCHPILISHFWLEPQTPTEVILSSWAPKTRPIPWKAARSLLSHQKSGQLPEPQRTPGHIRGHTHS